MTNFEDSPQSNDDKFDKIDEPSDRELILLTAEEYLSIIGKDDEDTRSKRKAWVQSTSLQHEIDAQEVLINELVVQYNETPDEGTAQAIEEAKYDLGTMLVDRLNLPPS